jgi:hypothetical protein
VTPKDLIDWLITTNALSGGAGERAAQRRGERR